MTWRPKVGWLGAVTFVLVAMVVWVVLDRYGADVDGGDRGSAQEAIAAAEPERSDAEPVVRVTRDDGSLPQGCGPRAIASTVIDFLTAVNVGDAAATDFVDLSDARPPTIAPNGAPVHGQSWYSVSERLEGGRRRHFVASDSEQLAHYFARRATKHEQLLLRQLAASSQGGSRVDIEYKIRRRADDLRRRGRLMNGKGSIDCEHRKITVWSMGNSDEFLPRRAVRPLCPKPSGRRRLPPLVCTMR